MFHSYTPWKHVSREYRNGALVENELKKPRQTGSFRFASICYTIWLTTEFCYFRVTALNRIVEEEKKDVLTYDIILTVKLFLNIKMITLRKTKSGKSISPTRPLLKRPIPIT